MDWSFNNTIEFQEIVSKMSKLNLSAYICDIKFCWKMFH